MNHDEGLRALFWLTVTLALILLAVVWAMHGGGL